RGQIILISGEAGMGKSRMASEGIRIAHRSKLIGYGGVCKSDGVNTPYLVWNPVWNAFFDIDPALPLRKQVRTIENEIEYRVPENLDAMPLLSSILGLPLPENEFTRALQPKDRKNQLEALLLKCLESAARESAEEHGGLFFVLEDLHWADPVSLDLLELIARAVETLPILLLLTHRPLDLETQAPSLSRIQTLEHFTEIRLDDLNLVESEQIIRAKLTQLFPGQRKDVSQSLIERITARAQGNPFYLEELLNYLHDRGIDPRNEAELSSLELPSSLHSLILSRIDQLTPSQQFLIKVAAIIGRIFRFDDLSGYYPWQRDFESLREDLQASIRADLISMESPEPELVCLFRHLVIHEVGYENIAFTTRVQLHGLYARYLEKTYPERINQLAPQLAHHFEMAQIKDKAVTYLIQSGEQAAANYANDESLSYFNRALKWLIDDESSRAYFDILWKRERVYDLLGQRTEQRQDLATLTRLAGLFDDSSNLRTQLFIRQARMEIDFGDYAAAKMRTQSAIQELTGHPQTIEESPDLLVDTLLLEARTMFLTGQAVAAKPQLDEALSLSRTYQYVRGEYNALANLGLWHWYKSENTAAADLLKQSLELIRRAGDVRREVEILNNLGIVTKDMYKFNEAIAHYENAQRIAKKIGDRSNEASLLTNMGRASLVSCNYMEAESYCARAAALAAEINEATVQSLALHNRSEALRELGQFDLAQEVAEESLKLVRASGYKVGEANTLENLAMIELARGDHARALTHAEKALTITREISSRRVEASVLTRIGYIRLGLGQLTEAESSLNEARTIEREVDEPILRLEIQAGLVRSALARGGSADLDSARTSSQLLMDELLQEPPTEQSHVLPLGLFLITIRVLRMDKNPNASKLIARAGLELRARSERISNEDFCASYVDLPEHREILALAKGDSQP
ncbi:MAG TPA: tetratricopeptide repeat protein, partial [Anaerolineales bacterium]|nr:tetratricopeptide repeat protein [Anaerolineales bacterium]